MSNKEVSGAGAGAPSTMPDGRNNHGNTPPRGPPPACPAFKLRPRNSQQLPSYLMNNTTPNNFLISPDGGGSPSKKFVQNISPDGPLHPLSAEGGTTYPPLPNKMPPPTFASFFGQQGVSGGNCSSPIKKQKTIEQDRLRLRLNNSPGSSPSDDSSCDDYSPLRSPPVVSSLLAPTFPPLMAFPSTPTRCDGKSSSTTTTPSGKRKSMPTEEDEGEGNASPSQTSSPFTPQGRKMMQNLTLNSPSTGTLSSVSPTPETSSTIQSQLIHQNQLPSVPTFSFSPSLKGFPPSNSNRDNRSTTEDSSTSVRETIDFSTAGSIPFGGTANNSSSATSSPFHSSLRGQRTPIGHHRGSVFNALPPRLYPNGREDDNTTCCSTSAFSCTGNSVRSSSVADNNSSTFTSLCSSPFTASPSPRVVPLTVLSRDGSPGSDPQAQAAFDASSSSTRSFTDFPSPLMRSLDLEAKESKDDLLSQPRLYPDIAMPKVSQTDQLESSPLSSSGSGYLLLPRIKLTPRGKNNFTSAKLMPSPPRGESSGDGLTIPRMSLLSPPNSYHSHNNVIEPASSFVVDSPGDKEAAEMDNLLHGFGHWTVPDDDDDDYDEGDPKKEQDAFGRVESEDAEMVALTQGPFNNMMQGLWLPPPDVPDGKSSTFTITDYDAPSSQLSPRSSCDQKPMPSITLNHQGGGRDDDHSSSHSPSFLPRPVSVSHQNKSRSLFDSSSLKSSADPLRRILQADAIAEAGRSDEPLTDDEDEENADFLLCLPQVNQESEKHHNNNVKPLKTASHAGFRTESPYLNRRAESPSFMSVMRRNKYSEHSLHGLSSPTTPTIYEEEFANIMNSVSQRSLHSMPTAEEGLKKREPSDATFCTLSDCESSEFISYCRSTTKALGASKDRPSVGSLLSMTSLCGLDIVHEAGGEIHDNAVLLPSVSSEFSAYMFKPLRRSELSERSMNSLGLSLDSTDQVQVDQRDLCTPTPPVATRKSMLSPPPLLRGQTNTSPL